MTLYGLRISEYRACGNPSGGKRKMVFRGLPRACWEFLFFRHQGKMGMVFGVIDSPQPQHTVLAKKASYEIRR